MHVAQANTLPAAIATSHLDLHLTHVLCLQTTASSYMPLWREQALFSAVDQSKADALAHNALCHPLLTALEGVYETQLLPMYFAYIALQSRTLQALSICEP